MTPEERAMSDAVMRYFGVADPVEDRPFGDLSDAELEAELAKAKAGAAAYDDVLDELDALGNNRDGVTGVFITGLPERLHAADPPNELEAEVDRLFGLADDEVVTIAASEIARLLAEANSFNVEVERSLSEQRESEDRVRAEQAAAAEAAWPMYRDFFGWADE
jgi:hypothetical protein